VIPRALTLQILSSLREMGQISMGMVFRMVALTPTEFTILEGVFLLNRDFRLKFCLVVQAQLDRIF